MLIVNQVEKLKKLSHLSYFDKNTLSQFVELPDNSLYANINRWLASEKLIQLKKGWYVTSDFIHSLKSRETYILFLANKLREPSYLSLEWVLQRHGILSEAVYALTSVTLKSKRVYKNRFGVFLYRNLKEDLFQGYEIKTIDGFSLKLATKAKALFDYFYFKLFWTKKIDKALIRSFRLNFEELSQKDFREFSHYCKMTKVKKMMELADLAREIR